MTPEQKLKALLQKASALTGTEIAAPVIPVKIETQDDIVRQAQAVVNFFTIDAHWDTEQCRTCLQWFAYQWHYKGVKYCSIQCGAAALRRIGLEWDPDREPERRWGLSAPAIVPPSVLRILRQLLSEIPGVPLHNTSHGLPEQMQLELFAAPGV